MSGPSYVAIGLNKITGSTRGSYVADTARLPSGAVVVASGYFNIESDSGQSYLSLVNPASNAALQTIQLNATQASYVAGAHVATDAAGGFGVVYTAAQSSSVPGQVVFERFDATGQSLSRVTLAGSADGLAGYVPAANDLAALGSGYVAVWTQSGANTAQNGIYTQRLDANGTPVGAATLISAPAHAVQGQAQVATLTDGSYVVVWQDDSRLANDSDIHGRHFDASGNAIGGDFIVNSELGDQQTQPAITALYDGGFAVAWTSIDDIKARTFYSSGGAVGADFNVATSAAGVQQRPQITAYPEGNFIVTWQDQNNAAGIQARTFGDDGRTYGDQFQISPTAGIGDSTPSVTVLRDGTLEFAFTTAAGTRDTQVEVGRYAPYGDAAATSGNAVVRTLYLLPNTAGSQPGTNQYFELDRDVRSGNTTLVAADLYSVDGTHFDATTAGVIVDPNNGTIFVGGKVNGVSFVAPRATNDFVIQFDPNNIAGATFDYNPVKLTTAPASAATPSIMATYYELLGRPVNADELTYWTPRFDNGQADVPTLRYTIAHDPSAGATVRSMINALYVEFGGRPATTAEQDFWANQVGNGTRYAGVRAAIIDDPLGHNHVAQVTAAIYQEYGGRAPTANEIAFWTGQVRNGTSYDGIRTAVLDDPLGKNHTAAELNTLYQEYFHRAPSAGEVSVWDGLLHKGADHYYVTGTLLLDHGSDATTRRLDGTGQPDTFNLGSQVGHVVIDDFNPLNDKIKLSGTPFAGTNVLDDAHAHDVFLNGSYGVLITLDDHNVIFLEHVQRAQIANAGNDIIV